MVFTKTLGKSNKQLMVFKEHRPNATSIMNALQETCEAILVNLASRGSSDAYNMIYCTSKQLKETGVFNSSLATHLGIMCRQDMLTMSGSRRYAKYRMSDNFIHRLNMELERHHGDVNTAVSNTVQQFLLQHKPKEPEQLVLADGRKLTPVTKSAKTGIDGILASLNISKDAVAGIQITITLKV